MPLIHVTNRAGDSYSVDADTGLSLMDVLRERGDVEAICGGSCACATCHVHIEESWLTQVGAPESDEQALLEYSLERRPGVARRRERRLGSPRLIFRCRARTLSRFNLGILTRGVCTALDKRRYCLILRGAWLDDAFGLNSCASHLFLQIDNDLAEMLPR